METFDIAAPSLTPLLVGGAIIAALVTGAAAFSFLLARINRIRFEVTDHALVIHAPFYGRIIARAKLELGGARVVALSDDPSLALRRRRNGLALPGVKLGWYRIASARRALVFLARGDQVLYLPTADGFPLLLETPDPEALLETLRGRPSCP